MKTKKVLLTGLMFLLLIMAVPGTVMAAGKKTVYVLTSVTAKGNGEYGITNETKLSYNKKGLLSKATIPSTSLGWPAQKLKASYNSKGELTKVVLDDTTRVFTRKYSYKSGKLQKQTYIVKSSSGEKSTSDLTYKWKGKTFTLTIKNSDTGETDSIITGKMNSKKRPLSLTMKYPGSSSVDKTKYQYDSKGFLKTINNGNTKTVFKNTVKSGRLKKSNDGYTTYTLKYKKIKVPSSSVKKVTAQQNYILNFLTENWYLFNYPMW